MATLVLVLVILGLVRSGRDAPVVATAVGAWVAAAIIGTSSTGFANPAVTVARTLTGSFTGIAPGSVPPFLAVQVLGALAAAALVVYLFPAGAERTVAAPLTEGERS